jgi:hypothetical protein
MLARITLLTFLFAMAGCGPGRTSFARYPAATPAFDRAGSDPKALEIADRVVAAAGGQDRWNAAKQIRWSASVTTGKASPPVTFDEAWDRWNGRHYNRRHTPAGDIIVMRSLYEAGGTAFGEVGHSRQGIGAADTERAMANARARWELDTTTLFLPFLLEAPGTKLELVGEAPGEVGQPPLDELKVTFDPKDPTRTATYHAMVNRGTNQIERIEIVKAGDPDTKRLGYHVTTWTEVGGMKLGTVYQNIGFADEVLTFSDLAVAAEADEALFVPTVQ